MTNLINDMKNDKKRKMSPNSLKNLKPAKKGEIRNPEGKAKGTLDFKTHLKNIVLAVGKEKGIDIIKLSVLKAYTNNQILIAILRLLVPQESEANINVKQVEDGLDNLTMDELIKEFERDLKIYQQRHTRQNSKDSPAIKEG